MANTTSKSLCPSPLGAITLLGVPLVMIAMSSNQCPFLLTLMKGIFKHGRAIPQQPQKITARFSHGASYRRTKFLAMCVPSPSTENLLSLQLWW